MTAWLSIVSVVKDANADFARTLASIRSQSIDGVELVVVDSSSDRDGIPEVLDGFGAKYQWTAPEGVYTAMNIGLRAAQGTYVYFLNAGDTLLNPESLSAVASSLHGAPEWLYAEVQMSDSFGKPVRTPRWDYDQEQQALFSRGHFPCHQGTFAQRVSLLKLGGFDTSYRIVADYAMFLKLSQRSRPIHIDEEVAVFQPGGMSSVHWRLAMSEFHRARRSILAPQGMMALREWTETQLLLAKTAAYRGLWAPGRIGHGLVARWRQGE